MKSARSRGRRVANERGTVLIQVAVALLALLALASFVFDWGVMLVSRGSAQNAVDAGALAGARSLLMLEGDVRAREAAVALATQTRIFNENAVAANIAVTVPLACPPPWNTPNGCIKVDLSKQNVPTVFARLVNINSQGVKATATAMVGAGNSVLCIKPWIVADRWTDNSGTGSNTTGWDLEDVFNPGIDVYTPPGFRARGTPNDYGMQMALKGDRNQWSSGWSLEIELGGGNGANTYRSEIAGCPAWVPAIGIYNPQYPCASRADVSPARGCVAVRTGVRQGPTSQGVHDLIALDPNSSWNTGTNSVQGGCMANQSCNNPTGVNLSPRIAPIAIFDPITYANSGCSGNNCYARVINMLGFYIEGMCDEVFPVGSRPAWCGTHPQEVVVGRLMDYPGQLSSTAGAPGTSSFVETTYLVR